MTDGSMEGWYKRWQWARPRSSAISGSQRCGPVGLLGTLDANFVGLLGARFASSTTMLLKNLTGNCLRDAYLSLGVSVSSLLGRRLKATTSLQTQQQVMSCDTYAYLYFAVIFPGLFVSASCPLDVFAACMSHVALQQECRTEQATASSSSAVALHFSCM